MPQASVVIAGHICLDITPDLSALKAGALHNLLRPGKLTRVGEAAVSVGGIVANTGLALQKLGVPARLIGRVGKDAFGELVRKQLAATGAACALLEAETDSTSYTVVVAPPGIDRIFLHHAGANERFTDTDVPDAALDGAKLIHFGYPPMMPLMSENNGAAIVRLFRRAHEHGLATSLDMAAVDPQSPAARVDWRALLTNVLPHTDFFMPSAEEICFMLDKPRHAEWLAQAEGRDVADVLSMERDVAPLAEQLVSLGAGVVVIKCGTLGMYYRTAGADALATFPLPLSIHDWARRSGTQPAYKPRRVASATGAGDTGIAAFLASVLEGLDPEACVRRAAGTGACCVEGYDAVSGLLPFDELDRRVAAGWETIVHP